MLHCLCRAGANFCIFSLHATSVELLLFDGPDDARPKRVIPLDPVRNTTFCYWHVFVPGVKAGQVYGYRAFGPYDPSAGHRFDGSKVLLDPYVRAVVYRPSYVARPRAPRRQLWTRHEVRGNGSRGYDWEGDSPLGRPLVDSVIYELHVRGFTQNPNSDLSAEGAEPTRD